MSWFIWTKSLQKNYAMSNHEIFSLGFGFVAQIMSGVFVVYENKLGAH